MQKKIFSMIFNLPWAMKRESLEFAIDCIRSLSIKDIHSAASSIYDTVGSPLDTIDNLAVINIVGPITRYETSLSQIEGYASVENIMTALNLAVSDPMIKGIILSVNSPGGSVDGISELAGKIYETRQIKPVLAYISGDGASAAYWLASAASKIIVIDTAAVGSIGVYAAYMDYSKAQEMAGIKEVVIISSQSPKKRPDLNGNDGLAQIQENIDTIASIFISSVARYRGVNADYVLENYGQGAVFIGADAVKQGLADMVGTFDTAIIEAIKQTTYNGGKTAMNIDEIKANFPDVANMLAREGAEKERTRIKAITELETVESKEMISSFKWDGVSTAADVALVLVKAAKEKMADIVAARIDDTKAIPVIDSTDNLGPNADEFEQKLVAAGKKIRWGNRK